MKKYLPIVVGCLLWGTVFGAPTPSFEEAMQSPWTRLTIFLSFDPGCTGPETREQITITRDESEIMLLAKTSNSEGKLTSIPTRKLTQAEFTSICDELVKFYQVALREVDINEYFQSLPESEREKKLKIYYETHGQPIGGFGGIYFNAQFHSDKIHQRFTDAYADKKSAKAFEEVLRSLTKIKQR